MAKEETKKEYSLEKRLVDLHPKFLEAIKDVYPLAVLGSLSIAIAAFTTQTYQNTQTYAITAASLFLIAFAVSFLFKIISHYYLALVSYISTALATAFLFLVVFTFAQTIPMVSRSVGVIPQGVSVFVFLSFGYFLYRLRKRTESILVSLCWTIAIPLFLLVGCCYAIFAVAAFIVISVPTFVSNISFLSSLSAFMLFIVGFLVDIYTDRKKKKNSHKL